MAIVVTHRISRSPRVRGGSILRTARLLMGKLHARLDLTPQERANLYVSRTPIAVITASLGGHAPSRVGEPR
ncbi:MAG TPA: hypothetical protein VGC05_07340 [Mycobacterium sp.]